MISTISDAHIRLDGRIICAVKKTLTRLASFCETLVLLVVLWLRSIWHLRHQFYGLLRNSRRSGHYPCLLVDDNQLEFQLKKWDYHQDLRPSEHSMSYSCRLNEHHDPLHADQHKQTQCLTHSKNIPHGNNTRFTVPESSANSICPKQLPQPISITRQWLPWIFHLNVP